MKDVPGTIEVSVGKGGAGFAARDGGSVKKVDPGGVCDDAGVEVDMWVNAFQGEALKPGITWAEVRRLVKRAEQPWEFTFSPYPPGSIRVDVVDGGAGFAAMGTNLQVTNVDPGRACDKAGVTTDFRAAAFQGKRLAAGTTWASLRGLVKAADKPWMFVFEPCTGGDAPASSSPAAKKAPAPAPGPVVDDDMGPTEAEEKAVLGGAAPALGRLVQQVLRKPAEEKAAKAPAGLFEE
eukprot:COSAG01_NODE_18021_length_1105_cov_1.210736_1_plen_235_part_10